MGRFDVTRLPSSSEQKKKNSYCRLYESLVNQDGRFYECIKTKLSISTIFTLFGIHRFIKSNSIQQTLLIKTAVVIFLNEENS